MISPWLFFIWKVKISTVKYEDVLLQQHYENIQTMGGYTSEAFNLEATRHTFRQQTTMEGEGRES